MNIVLGVSGGIAAYKAPDLVRRLNEIGADVRVILTPNAARFVSPLALAAVSNHGVIVDQWGDPGHGGVDHIELARWANLLLVAPASANVIAKLAVGIADDALTTFAIAHRNDVVLAPAMNSFMFRHPTVTQNLETLRARGVIVVDPDSGLLACGDEGVGRMPDPSLLADFVSRHLGSRRDLQGQTILITAGPTREPIDPVRYLTNRSSGKMGYALAEAAARRGAEVTLVSGPTALQAPAGVRVELVMTAQEMYERVLENVDRNSIVIKAAAVADYTPVEVSSSKIKKRDGALLTLSLRETSDILESISSRSPRPFLVAFAAETDSVEDNAKLKLMQKNVDLIVANDVSKREIGFDSNENEVVLISRDGTSRRIPRSPKSVIADRILDRVRELLQGRAS